jgi:hypothetical protein
MAMKPAVQSRSRRQASTLVLAVGTIAILTFMAAYTLRKAGPKFRMAYQTAAWQEARLSAEAGVDVAMGELSRNAAGPAPEQWAGWKQSNGGLIVPALAATLNTINSILSLLGGSARISQPIFLDNLSVSGGGGTPAEVDVQLWAVYPSASSQRRWFRIRSMATCALPPPAYIAPDILDAPLRRYSLRTVRPQLRKDDVGEPMTIQPPSVSRTVEVLVEPILPFELAIFTDQSLSLGTSGTWGVDSYDSRDPLKSNPDGTYPGRNSPKVQENGNIANNHGRPAGSLYGPLIAANGAHVRGAVATNGGDDPKTEAHENVTGTAGLDPSRVRDDFFREMKPMARPATRLILPNPPLGLPFIAGPESAPTQYLASRNLGAFSVAPMPAGVKGAVVIMVNGDLDIASGTITIPPGVTVQIYVRGNIDFHSSSINLGTDSSQRAAQLQIYGEDSGTERRTLRADGNATICAAFYGPSYDVKLAGNVEWFGSVGARSFEMLGGGTGGFHYDEALGTVGAPISFRIARYVEDVRE